MFATYPKTIIKNANVARTCELSPTPGIISFIEVEGLELLIQGGGIPFRIRHITIIRPDHTGALQIPSLSSHIG